MKNLNEILLKDIIEQIGINISEHTLYTVWRPNVKPQKHIFNPQGKSALTRLEDSEFALGLLKDVSGLGKFLFAHEPELDKVKYVMAVLRQYRRDLESGVLTEEQKEKARQRIQKAKTLLTGTDETYVYYNKDESTGKIESITIENTKDISKGRERTAQSENRERIDALAKDDFYGIVEPLIPSDVEKIACLKSVGEELRFFIEYNSMVEKYNGDLQKLAELMKGQSRAQGFEKILETLKHGDFFEEMETVLRTYIEEIDLDKMYLMSALRFLEALEHGRIIEGQIPEVYRRLKLIQENTKKNSKIIFSKPGENKVSYGTRELDVDMRRFIVRGDDVRYLSCEKCYDLKMRLMLGDISLVNIRVEEFKALLLSQKDIDVLLKRFPNNYIFFLRKDDIVHTKKKILENIIGSGECSQDLLQLICEKTDISVDEICDLFDRGIISVGDLKSIREQTGEIITPKRLYGKYKDYRSKQSDDQEEARTQLERYALAYRNTELAGKNGEEIDEKGEEFIAEIGEDIEPSDLIPLYALDIISLKLAVDWGGENIIEQLLRNETLKPSDARHLRDNGLLDEKVLERLFKNNVNMSYSYQISLVSTVFDGQTPEEQKIREKLAQYYNIENGLSNSQRKVQKGTKRKNRKSEEDNEPIQRVKMRDPGAKFNVLSALDKNVRIEEGIIDGHIIFHYPNIDDGTVLIEKLHKITTNKQTGIIEIRADNESATYVMSEEEFIKMKRQLIQDGLVDRTQLTQRWWVTRDPEHWIPHAGIEGWENALKDRFNLYEDNSRLSSEELAKIEEFIKKSIESKKGEDR